MPANPHKTPCQQPNCHAWALRGSDPPLCSAPAGHSLGAAPGNHNAHTHGFYASAITRDELTDLLTHAADTTKHRMKRRVNSFIRCPFVDPSHPMIDSKKKKEAAVFICSLVGHSLTALAHTPPPMQHTFAAASLFEYNTSSQQADGCTVALSMGSHVPPSKDRR